MFISRSSLETHLLCFLIYHMIFNILIKYSICNINEYYILLYRIYLSKKKCTYKFLHKKISIQIYLLQLLAVSSSSAGAPAPESWKITIFAISTY